MELFAIAGLAIAQPALDVLSKNSEVLVVRRTTPLEAVLLTLTVLLAAPAVAWCIEVVAGLIVPGARRWVHALLVGLFVAILAEEVTKHSTELGRTALIVIGVVAGLAAAALVARVANARVFLRYLAFAPVVFGVLFLFSSQATKVIFARAPASDRKIVIHHPKRVVMIVLDEFPLETLLDGTGHVDAGLYPNFAALAGSSTWYRNDTTVAPYTVNAVPAIMTGQYPKGRSDLPSYSDHPDNIFTLLGGTYRMNVTEDITRLCPPETCPSPEAGESVVAGARGLVGQTADLWETFASPHRTTPLFENPFTAPQLPIMRKFVSSLKPSSGPAFDFLHVQMPHEQWRYLPSWQDTELTPNNPSDYRSLETWADEPSAVDAHERHILQTQATDRFIGLVIAKLKRLGVWKDSLVVVTADHGVAFDGGLPKRAGTNATADQILWTPLFIKAPGQLTGAVDDRPMQSVDIVPTVAAMLGAKIPWKIDGVSALGPPRPEFTRRLYQWETLTGGDQGGISLARGNGYLSFPAAPNFAKVLAARAAPSGGDPALRPYRIGPYGALVGTEVSGLIQDAPGGPTRVNIEDPAAYSSIDPTAADVPWAYLTGYVQHLDQARPLAIAVNGVVAGLATASPLAGSAGVGYFSGSVPPKLFRPGRNYITMYAISGPPGHPALDPIPVFGVPVAPLPSSG